jgi:hypothetical protein
MLPQSCKLELSTGWSDITAILYKVLKLCMAWFLELWGLGPKGVMTFFEGYTAEELFEKVIVSKHSFVRPVGAFRRYSCSWRNISQVFSWLF